MVNPFKNINSCVVFASTRREALGAFAIGSWIRKDWCRSASSIQPYGVSAGRWMEEEVRRLAPSSTRFLLVLLYTWY